MGYRHSGRVPEPKADDITIEILSLSDGTVVSQTNS